MVSGPFVELRPLIVNLTSHVWSKQKGDLWVQQTLLDVKLFWFFSIIFSPVSTATVGKWMVYFYKNQTTCLWKHGKTIQCGFCWAGKDPKREITHNKASASAGSFNRAFLREAKNRRLNMLFGYLITPLDEKLRCENCYNTGASTCYLLKYPRHLISTC